MFLQRIFTDYTTEIPGWLVAKQQIITGNIPRLDRKTPDPAKSEPIMGAFGKIHMETPLKKGRNCLINELTARFPVCYNDSVILTAL